MSFYDTDSLEEEEEEWNEDEDLVILMTMEMMNRKPKHGGSVVGHEVLRRRRQEADLGLTLDYFGLRGVPPVYPEKYFRRRFRMGTNLFTYISNVIKEKDTLFEQRRSCTGLLGHSTLQKMTAALRIMAYGIPADLVDANIAMVESTAIYCLKRFAKVIIKCVGERYLRAPNVADTQRILEMNAARGFPGMLGSIDCMH